MTMETTPMSDTQRSALLRRWQQLFFQENRASRSQAQSRDLADILRSQLAQTEHAKTSKQLSADASSIMFQRQLDVYSTIIDSTEQKGGVNNYADSVLAPVGRGTNESQQWKSSLKPDDVNLLPCLLKLSTATEIANGSLVLEGKESEVLIFPSGSSIAPDGNSNTPFSTGFHDTRCTAIRLQSHATGISAITRPEPAIPTVSVKDSSWASQKRTFPASFGSIGPEKAGLECGSTPVSRAGTLPTANFDFSGTNKSYFDAEELLETGKNVAHHANKQQIDSSEVSNPAFRTARQQLAMNDQKKSGSRAGKVAAGPQSSPLSPSSYGSNKRSLGARRGPGSKFIPPILNRNTDDDEGGSMTRQSGAIPNKSSGPDEPVDPRLKNFEPRMLELIMSEIMDHGAPVTWDDIAGLQFVKKTIKEIVIWPMLRPDIFTGLRGPPKGLLLFGPPGTGKTLIGKCIASQSKSTFFSISASSLTSKWVGEGEKMVRALFAVARVHQPAVVFIDEIDSLLSQRSDSEHESSRRIKTEFLVQLDGTSTGEDDRILVVGATNRPQEIDEAARRRFVKRLYVPLPEREARKQIVFHLMCTQSHSLDAEHFNRICDQTDGYSGADMANLCREAALGPIRSLAFVDIENIAADEVRPISFEDFESALKQVRASVSDRDLSLYIDWNKQYGSWGV